MLLPPPRSTRTDTLYPSTTLFRSLRIIGCSAFAKAIGGRFAVPAAVRRGHCRFAAARKFLPRAATGPRDVVAIFVVGKEGDIHRAAHARLVETALDRQSTRLNSTP